MFYSPQEFTGVWKERSVNHDGYEYFEKPSGEQERKEDEFNSVEEGYHE